MDTVISRLRNTVTTVTSTVSQLSVVLPGNPVTREFEVIKHVASGGPGLMWKIYSGFKKSTKQEASIFVFEKKLLDRWVKRDKDHMLESLRRGVTQLTKLRHPKVLTVQHPLEESRDSLAFATEPVFASLANVLGYSDNMPEIISPDFKNYKLHETEIKYGLLQLCEGLIFLHRDVKLIHGNLCPESVIINEQGSWKIFGLDFCIPAITSTSELQWKCKEYEPDVHQFAQPNLDYIAPEYSLNHSCSPASDMFSMGLLTYTTFSCGDQFVKASGNWHSHRQNLASFNNLSEAKLKSIPHEIRLFVKTLLATPPDLRPDPHTFVKVEYFYDEGVKTLMCLDSLIQWDNLQKSKFYKGLCDILPRLPLRVQVHRVVPCLAQEFGNPSMVPFVLPNVFKIAETASTDQFTRHILPHLREVMKLREPVQILYIFMKNMELLLQKTPPDITKSDVLPLIYGSLESDSSQVQELCLSIIPSFAALIDYPAMKNALLPRIRVLCINTGTLSVRVNCLVCIGRILESLDKWLVIDFVLPFLTEIQAREPAVIMGIIGILKLVTTLPKLGLTREIIATKLLPFLFPLTIESGLTVQQFSTIMSFIHDLIGTVESEQKAKLEQAGAVAKEQSNLDTFPRSFSSITMNGSGGKEIDGINFGSQHIQGSGWLPNPTVPASILSPNSSETKSGPMKLQAKPKDLTSTLIDSNLSQLRMDPGQKPTKSTSENNLSSLQFGSNPMGLNNSSRSTVNPNPSDKLLFGGPSKQPLISSGGAYNLTNPSPNVNLRIGTSSSSVLLPSSRQQPQTGTKTNKLLSQQDIDDFLS